MKKIFALSFLIFSCSTFAEHCPNVWEIKSNQLGEWRAFDSDNGEPLTSEQLAKYEKAVEYFGEAAYFDGALQGPSQCYYERSLTHDYLHAYLAHYALVPKFDEGNWIQQGLYAFCKTSVESCQFLAI